MGEGFVKGHAGKREEFWGHPDGRTARLSGLPVHLMVTDADSSVGKAIHVIQCGGDRQPRFPVRHETWEMLLSVGTHAYMLLVTQERRRLVPFSRIARDASTFPSAYMVQLPDDLLDQ